MDLEKFRNETSEYMFFWYMLSRTSSVINDLNIIEDEELREWINFIRNQFIHGAQNTSSSIMKRTYRYDHVTHGEKELLYFDFDVNIVKSCEIENFKNNKYFTENNKSVELGADLFGYEYNYLEISKKAETIIIALDLKKFNNILLKYVIDDEYFDLGNEKIKIEISEYYDDRDIIDWLDFIASYDKNTDLNTVFYIKFTFINMSKIFSEEINDKALLLIFISSTSYIFYDYIYRTDANSRRIISDFTIDDGKVQNYKKLRNSILHYYQEETDLTLIENSEIKSYIKYILADLKEISSLIKKYYEKLFQEVIDNDERRSEIIKYKIINIYTNINNLGQKELKDIGFIFSDAQSKYDLISFLCYLDEQNVGIKEFEIFYDWYINKELNKEVYSKFNNYWYCSYNNKNDNDVSNIIGSIRTFEEEEEKKCQRIQNLNIQSNNLQRTDFYKNLYFAHYIYYMDLVKND